MAPPADILEFPTTYKYLINVPGLSRNDITVVIEGDSFMKVIAEENDLEESRGALRHLQRDRSHVAPFICTFRLPHDAELQIEYEDVRDGVVTVIVPKKTFPCSSYR